MSISAFAADPLAQQAGIPMIANSNTAPNVTKIGDFIFRTSVPEDQVFPTVLGYVVKKHNIKARRFDPRARRRADAWRAIRAEESRCTGMPLLEEAYRFAELVLPHLPVDRVADDGVISA